MEGAEDDADGRQLRTAAALRLGAADVVLAVAASGGTPYTCAVRPRRGQAGALTVGLANNAGSRLLLAVAEHPVYAGHRARSSCPARPGWWRARRRKIALNLFSTRLMTELGRVYRGLMVGVVPSNAKLVARAQRIIAEPDRRGA